MNRFGGSIAYWGGKLLTDSLKDIKRYRDTSNYVERASDQIGYKPPQKSKKMPVKKRTSYGQKRKRDRAMMPRYTRRPAKKKKVYKRKTYKKRKPVTPSLSVKRVYDDASSLSRDDCAWLQFQHHGSRDRVLYIAAEAITRAILAELKVYPDSYDEPLAKHILYAAKWDVVFRAIKTDTGEYFDSTKSITTDIRAGTFTELSALLAQEMTSMMVGNVTNSTGYYPITSIIHPTGGYGHEHNTLNLDQAMVTINAFSKIRLQNMTRSANGLSGTDVVGSNPIQGKRYDFNSPSAIVHSALTPQVTDADAPNWRPFEDVVVTNGIQALPQLPDNHELSHPPMAKNTFQNCKTVKNCYIKYGGTVVEKHAFTKKVSVRQLINLLAPRRYDFWGAKNSFGVCSWYCLEKANRQSDAIPLSLHFNREMTITAFCHLKHKKSMMRKYFEPVITL